MSEPQPMYQKPQVLSRKTHAALRFTPVTDYAFASQQGTCPVVANEFVEAAAHYPLLFIRNGDGLPLPVVSTGLGLARNDFVDAQGQWRKGAYVPAYVRRYPFSFAELPQSAEDEPNLALCVDLAAPHFSGEGVTKEGVEKAGVEKAGVLLFEAQDGKPSVADQALAFCNRFQRSYRETIRLCEMLDELGLFVERQFRVSYRNEAKRDTLLKGCLIVDEVKLRALDDAAFLTLRENNYLPAIYAHLGSLRRLVALATAVH